MNKFYSHSTPATRKARRDAIAVRHAGHRTPGLKLNPAGVAAVAVSVAWFLVSVVEGLPL